MKVLIACEMSGIVREAFRKLSHEAYSCDLMPSEIPSKYHIQDDVLNHLDEGWDLMIAHPPCTFLARTNHVTNTKRTNFDQEQQEGKDFFFELLNAGIPRIAVENPVPIKRANMPPYTQIIQPWQFGHDYSKKTCLWLKNLPKLVPTNIVEISYITSSSGRRYTKGWYQTPRKSIPRSRTFQGIADAMAAQWSNPITLEVF